VWFLERENDMAKFRCLISGNIVEFTQQVDIDSMEGHSGYEWIDEDEEDYEEEVLTPPKKRMGRPPKNTKDK
jgi:hypothetical protein